MIVRFLLAAALLSAILPAASHAQWYGSADFVVPTRTVSPNNVFARNQVEEVDMAMPPAPTGDFLVGETSQLSLDLDFVAAGRFTIGRQVGEFGLEGTYLITDEWFDAGTVFDPASMTASPFTPVGGLVNAGLDNNSAVVAGYGTELQSIELNLTQLVYAGPNGEATLMYGVRGFAIDERFSWAGTNVGGTNTLDVARKNRMIGPQLGFRGWTPFPGGRVSINIAGAAAYNDSQGASVTTGAGFGGGFTIDESLREGTLIGELGIEYLFQMTPNAALRIGFEVLGLTDVALATNSSLLSDRDTAGVVYSQPYVGFMYIH